MNNPVSQSPLRLVPLCIGLALAGTASAQPQRASSQFGASAQLGTQSAPAAPRQAATTTPAWTLPAASAAQPVAPVAGRTLLAEKSAVSRGSLFELADTTPVVAGGRKTTAGALKQSIRAALVAKAGAAKTVPGGQRLQADESRSAAVGGKRVQTQSTRGGPAKNVPPGGGLGGLSDGLFANLPAAAPKRPFGPAPTTATAESSAPLVHRSKASAKDPAFSVAETRCLDKGPPAISEVDARLKPGGKLTVWGKCFGERAGRVEVIGQFPGGTLSVAFTGWEQTSVDIEVPATVRGATDHTVAVTVVTADGKRSPAMQAQFVAARERVEVPDRLWSPGSAFELAAITESGSGTVNAAAAGHLSRSLRINPQCGLHTMEAVVLSGSVSAIRGWEQGKANEASVTIDWAGTCLDTTTTTNYNYVVTEDREVSVRSACRVALQPRAWAYCPAGVAP